jgi:hypothetical protein
MKSRRLARFGLMLGLAGLFGCAPVPTPQVSVAPAPVAVPMPPPPPPPPGPIALVPIPVPVAVMPPPPPPAGATMPGHQAVSVAHRVIHHRWLRRYAALGTYGPPCGSDVHPCYVFHTVVPVQ